MSSTKKLIINITIVVLVIALLSGAVYFLTRPEESPNLNEIFTDDDRYKIFSTHVEDITAAHVTNKNGSYTLARGDRGWSLVGFEGVDLNYAMLDSLTTGFSDVTSSQKIEEAPEDLSPYGLKNPAATLEINTVDGGKTFYIGNETPDGASRYFNTDSSSDVYLMDGYVAAVALLTARDFVNLGSTFTADDITEIRISSAVNLLHVVQNSGGPRDQYALMSYWDIIEPSERSASNSDIVQRLTTPAAELEDSTSAILTDTPENRAATGLNDPFVLLEVTAAGKRIVYQIGAADGEYRYIFREDSGFITRIDNDACSFLNTTAYDVAEKYLALIDITTLKSVEFSYGGKTDVFKVKNSSSENPAFSMNNKSMTEEDARNFYQQVIALPVNTPAEDEPMTEIIGSITYTLNSGDELKLEFTKYDDRSYSAYINGQRQYIVLRKNVDSIFDLLKEF